VTESNVAKSSEASAPRTDGRSAGGDFPRTDDEAGDGRPDYRGPFDAAFDYEDLSKDALVRLVREYALIVHILDRSMCAAIGLRHGLADMEALAIEEWKGASPVYGERLRRVMAVEGDGIEAIFKVLQLDPGFPHHYLDVHYEVVDDRHGYFELAWCGALMDAEPYGERMVTSMCHHIEDGTFDVTAQAVNPKARIRHVHRPPRSPGGRVPHCRWEVVIDDDTETLPEAEITKITRLTTAATFEFPPMKDGTPHVPDVGAGAPVGDRRPPATPVPAGPVPSAPVRVEVRR
jgi:hypothetical protein